MSSDHINILVTWAGGGFEILLVKTRKFVVETQYIHCKVTSIAFYSLWSVNPVYYAFNTCLCAHVISYQVDEI